MRYVYILRSATAAVVCTVVWHYCCCMYITTWCTVDTDTNAAVGRISCSGYRTATGLPKQYSYNNKQSLTCTSTCRCEPGTAAVCSIDGCPVIIVSRATLFSGRRIRVWRRPTVKPKHVQQYQVRGCLPWNHTELLLIYYEVLIQQWIHTELNNWQHHS